MQNLPTTQTLQLPTGLIMQTSQLMQNMAFAITEVGAEAAFALQRL